MQLRVSHNLTSLFLPSVFICLSIDLQVFGIGDSGLKIQIEIHPNPQSIINGTTVPLDHRPSWKVAKEKDAFLIGLTKLTLMKQRQLNTGNTSIGNSIGNTSIGGSSGNGSNTNVDGAMMNNNNNNNNMYMPNNMQHQQQQQNYMQPLMQQQQQQQPFQQQPNQPQTLYAYGEHEDVQGVVHLVLPPGRKFESLGVKIQFVGRVDMVSVTQKLEQDV